MTPELLCTYNRRVWPQSPKKPGLRFVVTSGSLAHSLALTFPLIANNVLHLEGEVTRSPLFLTAANDRPIMSRLPSLSRLCLVGTSSSTRVWSVSSASVRSGWTSVQALIKEAVPSPFVSRDFCCFCFSVDHGSGVCYHPLSVLARIKCRLSDTAQLSGVCVCAPGSEVRNRGVPGCVRGGGVVCAVRA